MEEELNDLREILVASSNRREVEAPNQEEEQQPHAKQAPPPNTIALSKTYIWTVHPALAAR